MSFKQSLITIASISLLSLSSTVFATSLSEDKLIRADQFFARCTQIRFYEKGKTLFGQQYKRYMVRCSDGTQAEITGWEGNQWCVGRGRSECTNNQLETANKACK